MEEGKAQNSDADVSGQNAEENKTATENPKENDVSGEKTTGDEEGQNAATENPKENDVSGEKTTGDEGQNAEENKTATETPKENDVSGEKTTGDEGQNAEENKTATENPKENDVSGDEGGQTAEENKAPKLSLNKKEGHGECFWGFLEYDEKKEVGGLQLFLDEEKALELTNDLEKNFVGKDFDTQKQYNLCIVKLNDPDTYCIGGDWSQFVKDRDLRVLRDVGFSKIGSGIVGIKVLAETTSSEDD